MKLSRYWDIPRPAALGAMGLAALLLAGCSAQPKEEFAWLPGEPRATIEYCERLGYQHLRRGYGNCVLETLNYRRKLYEGDTRAPPPDSTGRRAGPVGHLRKPVEAPPGDRTSG